MLPNHAPLVVAEQLRCSRLPHPGRNDLGTGRASGTDPLRRSPTARRGGVTDEAASTRFPEYVDHVRP